MMMISALNEHSKFSLCCLLPSFANKSAVNPSIIFTAVVFPGVKCASFYQILRIISLVSFCLLHHLGCSWMKTLRGDRNLLASMNEPQFGRISCQLTPTEWVQLHPLLHPWTAAASHLYTRLQQHKRTAHTLITDFFSLQFSEHDPKKMSRFIDGVGG